MGNIVDVLEEVRLRMEAAKDAAAVPVKAVFVGSYEEKRNENCFPIINIDLMRGTRNSAQIHLGATDNIDIEIRYIDHKMVDDGNKIYKTTGTKGPVYYLEQMLNYLEKDRVTGNPDLDLAGTSFDTYNYNFILDYSAEGMIQIIITMSVKTARFIVGVR